MQPISESDVPFIDNEPEVYSPVLQTDPETQQRLPTFLARLQEQDEREFAEQTSERVREFLSQPSVQQPQSKDHQS